MIEVRPIQPGDFEQVMEDPYQKSLKSYPEMKAPSNSVTVIFEDEIVAVAGIIAITADIGELWLALTEKSKKVGIFGLAALTTIERTIDALVVDNGFKTATAEVRGDFPDAQKMVRVMGFKEGETLKGAAPDGCDLIRYTKVFRQHKELK